MSKFMLELDNEKRRLAEEADVAKRDQEVRRVFRNQRRFLNSRSDLAPGNGLRSGDQQYRVTDSETGETFLVLDRRLNIAKKDLAADIRRQVELKTGMRLLAG